MRRTKIIATLGPATDQDGMIEKLFDEGVDVFRLNYSHQTCEVHEARAAKIREVSIKNKRAVAIIADLQGPKIRLEQFNQGEVELREGSSFVIDTNLDTLAGDENHVGVSYKSLPKDVQAGDTLLVDDGRIILEVVEVVGQEVKCRVVAGGVLSNNKGLNLQGGGLSVKTLTDKDRTDLISAVKINVDYIAVSFTRLARDIHETRELLKQRQSEARIIAKIERAEAVKNIDPIIKAADAIMIARGDLGVEIGYAALPSVQKSLIKKAREMDRLVITATQMMESMIDHQMPTRAEVFDVANAVLDGSDAVMLSGETSVGNYPDKVVRAMSKICEESEKQRGLQRSDHRINQEFKKIDEAIAMSTMYAANHLKAKAIISLTETGATCLCMSRISSGIPVFAFTRHEQTRRRVSLYRGVYPVKFDVTHADTLKINEQIIDILIAQNILTKGDFVLITKGDYIGKQGGTNNMKIIQVKKT